MPLETDDVTTAQAQEALFRVLDAREAAERDGVPRLEVATADMTLLVRLLATLMRAERRRLGLPA